MNFNDVAHEVWSAAQLMPGEGIEDAVARIERILRIVCTVPKPTPASRTITQEDFENHGYEEHDGYDDDDGRE